MAKRETVAQAYERGRVEGFQRAKAAFGEEMRRHRDSQDSTRVKVQLIGSVGQALDAQTRLVSGLANLFDNTGGLRD